MGAGKATVRQLPDITHDLVVVIPGIMGSELVDVASGDVLWGLHPGAYAKAWLTGSTLRRMRLTDAERDGRYDRIEARRLLSFPSWLSFLQGVEPYTDLVRALRQVVADPAAVLEFPYDWRLPVSYNAGRLAERAMARLDWWRAQPAHEQARRDHPAGRPAQLVLIAHSMGGLLARELALIPGVSEHIRTTITLGTPFHGAPKAALMINTGRNMSPPLPANRPLTSALDQDPDDGVRALAATLPGIYDLLPSYRCVISTLPDGAWADRRLTIDDIVDLGGDRDLAVDSERDRTRRHDLPLSGHELLLGRAQATVQGLTVADGICAGLDFELRPFSGVLQQLNRLGDGTVPTGSAELPGRSPRARLSQQHGALARAADGIQQATDLVLEIDPDLYGPRLSGEDGIGVQLPDTTVPAGVEWAAVVTGISHPRQVVCAIESVETGRPIGQAKVEARDGRLQAPIVLPAAGLYRIVVAGSGESPTSQLIAAR
jgi:hypothetical protein